MTRIQSNPFKSPVYMIICLLSSFNAFAEENHDLASNQYDSEYVFDELMFKGKSINPEVLSRLNTRGSIEPGIYPLEIYTNGAPSGRAEVPVYLVNNKSAICLTEDILQRIGVKPDIVETLVVISLEKNAFHHALSCFDLDALDNTEIKISNIDQRLIVNLPSNYLYYLPKDYIPVENLAVGNSMAFLNYYVNQYHRDFSGHINSKDDSVFATFSTGMNFGLWRLRHESNYSYSRNSGKTRDDWNNIRTYVKRALPSIQSKLTIGQNYTTGSLLSGLSYTGVELASEMRMLPASMRDYAPMIRGVANTNAKVTVRQNDIIIYEKTVAPGTFEINDVQSTYYKSDFYVTVEEADGVVHTFIVPYIMNAQLLRPGLSQYSLVAGKLRQDGIDETYFGDATYQLGLSNDVTLNSGLRVSRNYASVLLGAVYGSPIGAFSSNITTSHAKVNDDRKNGWIWDLDYSHSIYPTNTSFSLGGSLYSHSEYLNITDVAFLRRPNYREDHAYRYYQLRARARALVSQSISDSSTVFASYSSDFYRNTSDKATQFQLGYNKTFDNNISMSASVIRQRSLGGFESQSGTSDTTYSISLSMPLQNKQYSPFLSSTVSHSKESGTYYQAGLNGQIGEENRNNYNVNMAYDDGRYNDNRFTVGAGIQSQRDLFTVGLNASKGKDYWQQSSFLRGAAVFHSGGVTFAPYVSDTFALVEAKGAEGATIGNGIGTKVNRSGYAIYPSLIPYQYNTIYINTEGTKNSVDIVDGSYRVAPFSGMAVKVKFLTSQGYPLLINVKNDSVIPLGSVITDGSGQFVSMMGQANQVYLRANDLQGSLTVAWGDGEEDHCDVNYDISQQDLTLSLIQIDSECVNNET